MASKTYEVRIYTCVTHPHWSLEDRTPVIKAGLRVFCPLCRDEFFAHHIGVADCRIETREAVEAPAVKDEQGPLL
jgi:hypothetical protein